MNAYVAFLRGVNVGGRQVKMAVLRQAFEEMGFAEVETFIASGNVGFGTTERAVARIEARIERGLAEQFGFDIAVFVRTRRELASIADVQPFTSAAVRDWKSLYVCFAKDDYSRPAARAIEALATEHDRFAVDGREVYWLCRTSVTGSLVPPGRLGKALGLHTNRNMKTVRRLAAKYRPV
jgi:uncharacterized protein (DUF1697 family)